ncbi:MarR family EPS-associated transcriptional regulator [Roseivivax sp. CAU 1753]
MAREINEDVRFRVLRALEQNPNLSQRDLSRELGLSLGLVNYCLKALAEKGHVKFNNFRASDTKLHYAYVLTPKGIAAKLALTQRFLKRRMDEYEALEHEIERLRAELHAEK